MDNPLNQLSDHERIRLLRAPALVSILAASTDGKFDKKEKKEAIELSHWRTFSRDRTLNSYYKEVEKVFKPELEQLLHKYEPFEKEDQKAMKKELEMVHEIIKKKLDPLFARKLSESLKSYAHHVGHIHNNFLEYFAFPVNIKGITE